MSLPTLVVGVALGIPEAGDFILDDATRGMLDSPDYVLASGYTTVTADSFNVSITRGRFSRLWDSVDAGSCTVSLRNMDRDYDPSYLGSPYNRFIVPGRGVRVTANGVDVWTGFVNDWQLDYEVDGPSTATAISTDALGMFGQLQFDEWTSVGDTAGTKLSEVCNRSEVAWPSWLRDFDEGVEVLNEADAVSWGSSVLNHCQNIARSELGYLYATPSGVLTYRDRTVAIGATSLASFSDTTGVFYAALLDEAGDPILDEDGAAITVEVDVIAYQGITASLGSELLFSHVRVDREGGTAQSAVVADTAAWMDLYGPLRSLSISGLLLDTDAQSLALAEYLLSLYDSPRYRISELRVDITPLSDAQQSTVLALDITDMIDVTYTPDGVGDAIYQPLVIQGIRHSIGTERHVVEFSVIDAPIQYFRLDDAVYGYLDDDILGF